ncbi:Uncharacterised protein [uncultured archaeon]|nr:Uncharacterised protein [uncultured archaeon]
MGTKTSALSVLFLLALAGALSAQAACQSYGEACGGNCCAGLVCDAASGRCTQNAETCSNMPPAFAPAPPQPAPGSGGTNVTANITQLEGGTGIIGAGTGLYQVGWFSDWRAAGITGVAIVVMIIAIAAMAGHAFNLPEVKAFADTEMMQAVVSVLLIASLLLLVSFLDLVAQQALSVGNLPITCNTNEPCYITASKFYLDTLYATSEQYAGEQLRESVETQKAASTGTSMQANWWVLLYAGSTIRYNAGMSIPAERAGAIFETVSRLMASLYAQRYFIDVISFGIAPIFMLLGIVLRTFFFTRKLGGLLLAIAISLFIIYPLTFAFAWYTLNVTVYGERTYAVSDPYCPAECTARYPVAFFVNATTGGIVQFDTTQAIQLAGINNSNWNAGDGTAEFPGLVACRNLSKIGILEATAPNQCPGCPDYCREAPLPTNLPGCNVTSCSTCNAGCKIMRQRADCYRPEVCPNCPNKCRTALPVENKCYYNYSYVAPNPPAPAVPANLSVSCAGCSGCPQWCMFLLRNSSGDYEQVYETDPDCNIAACRPPSLNGGTCPSQCMYSTEIGEKLDCDSLCTYQDSQGTTECPRYCRVDVLFGARNDTWIAEHDFGGLNATCNSPPKRRLACMACPVECQVPVPLEANASACAPYPSTDTSGSCVGCPESCRYSDYRPVPPGFVTSYSNLNFTANPAPYSTSVPYMCRENFNGVVKCADSADCGNACKLAQGPKTCMDYRPWPFSPPEYCQKCPLETRTTLTQVGSGNTYVGPVLLDSSAANCNDTACGLSCKSAATVPFSIAQPAPCLNASGELCNPNAWSGACCQADFYCRDTLAPTVCAACGSPLGIGALCRAATAGCCAPGLSCTSGATGLYTCQPSNQCYDYNASYSEPEPANCQMCRPGCRVDVSNPSYLAPECRNATLGGSSFNPCDNAHCPASCRANLITAPKPQVCEAYLGNGVVSGPEMACFGPMLPVACPFISSEAACSGNSSNGCIWLQVNSSSVPISYREAPYNDSSGCRQCPENCMLNGTEDACVDSAAGYPPVVDCSYAACPAAVQGGPYKFLSVSGRPSLRRFRILVR